MNIEMINHISTWIALSAVVPCLLFTIIYGLGSPWYKSWLGRTLFGLMFSITMLFVVILLRRFFGEYTGYYLVSLVAYTLLTLMFWSFLVIFLIERRKSRNLRVPLRKDSDDEAR